ncbi:hypothetical protein NUU61_009617 [Penicillium alfredii]|uniref:Uncharacterized protein n=1 Tax=Penicillium alfredii TaxID=1506179 RepID=A0A9W9EGF2_9EURO|nr:uncharacterized protein NUU61_009617 [Penicillium alfredii]KAJ5081353.1 hypothetical protein NUU61_009617 [Penicillium alfredii]
MSNPPDRPWTEEERYTLLTEILKKAGIPSSHLVRMIRDFRIAPNWGDIPLPSGRSLNSCQLAFYHMCQQPAHPPTHPASFPPRLDVTGPPAPPMDPSALRKRPLYPSDKPALAPRALQPRPSASTVSYSSASGASVQLSPRLESSNEPPRKRGRPSKAETERRKAVAEARGETYPPPRRSNSGPLKIPPSPTSPATAASAGTVPSPAPLPPPGLPPAPMHYEGPASRPPALPPGPSAADERRDLPSRSMGSNLRELPRPTELGHTLPSPHTLQLGPRDSFPRLGSNPVERPSYSSFAADRFSPPDSGRRDSVTSQPNPPYNEGRMSTAPAEKPPR